MQIYLIRHPQSEICNRESAEKLKKEGYPTDLAEITDIGKEDIRHC